ncbi:hypothetical protein MCOR25_009701 [Pyricularia grisea]|nr:hypothetical protein MCOR25_009701 [Pyricularia grisea]
MNVPLVEPPSTGAYDFPSLLIKGYFDNPNQPYKLAGPKSDLILLPPRYAGELGTYGSSKLSFGAAIHDFWVSPHTTWRYHLDDETGRQTLMGSFKRNGANIVRQLDEEIILAFSQWRDVTDHWTELAINPSIRPLINQTFGRVLVGAPLCRSKEWLDCASGLGLKLMLAARDLRGFPSWAQPWVKHFLPTYRALMRARRPLVRLSEPLVRKKMLGLGMEKINGREDHDMINYQIKHAVGWRAMDVDFHTGQLFDNVFAGDNQLVNALLQCIYDLAAHPEYHEPLRDEIRAVCGKDDQLTIETLARLRRVDSFMKEVVRLRPGTLIVMARKALVDVTLSDGLVVPRGVTVAMPSFALNHDPSIYGDDAAEFKPFRFVQDDQEGDFTKVTPAHLAFESTVGAGLDFGRGKATCPGRYYALWVMKVVFVRFVLNYEVKLKPGAERPPNIDANVHKIANLQGDILIRRLQC